MIGIRIAPSKANPSMKEQLGIKDEDEKQKQREKTTYVAPSLDNCLEERASG